MAERNRTREIKIPFKEVFREPILSGRKIYTTRTGRFGEVGDWFRVFGAKFELVAIIPSTGTMVGNHLYREEGFNSPAEFSELWQKIHPHLNLNAVVYVHAFRKIDSSKLTLIGKGEIRKQVDGLLIDIADGTYGEIKDGTTIECEIREFYDDWVEKQRHNLEAQLAHDRETLKKELGGEKH